MAAPALQKAMPMDALLRSTFSHRSLSFWAWVVLLTVATFGTLWALAHLLTGGQAEAQRAFAEGQRILISINDGRITGTLAPAPAAEETPIAKPEEPAAEKPAEPAAEEPNATPPSDATAAVEAEAAATAEHAPTMPAARIPPQDTPQVTAHEITPPADAAPAEAKPAETATPAAEPAAPVKAPEPAVTPEEKPAATAEAPAKPAETPAAPAEPAIALKPLEETTPIAPVAMAPSKAVSRPLNEAPIARLVDDTKAGKLPRIGADGTEPWQAYGKPAPAIENNAPRIAIVVLQVGLNASMVETTMNLPEDVTLSISPYAQKADAWIAMARNRGHEALLDLPMEPKDFPISDAGPLSLSPREKPAENIARLQKVLASSVGYAGVVATPNEHFLSQAPLVAPVLAELGKRGVFLVSNNPRAAMTLAQLKNNTKLASLSNSQLLDGTAGEETLRAQLQALETAAQKDGSVIGMLRPTPLGLKQLNAWMADAAKRGIVFVPASSLLPKPTKKGMQRAEVESHDARH